MADVWNSFSKLECNLEHQLSQSLSKTASSKGCRAFVCISSANRVRGADMENSYYCAGCYECFLIVVHNSGNNDRIYFAKSLGCCLKHLFSI